MKEKFKQWVTACRLAADQGAGNVDDLRKLADILNSLADMSKDEPDDLEFTMGSNTYLTKANRDWWKQKQFSTAMYRADLANTLAETKRDLAAANARIAELEQYKEWVAPQLEHAIEIEHANNKADQPRPLLKDQPEVFDALVNMIQAIAYERTLTCGLNSDSLSEYHDARKLLVGE